MTNQNLTTLINFRIFTRLLEPLDNACQLEGKTRTKALIDLIEGYVREVGVKAEQRLDESDLIHERLKSAVSRLDEVVTHEATGEIIKPREKRLKRKFSSFQAPEEPKRTWADMIARRP